jgi:hypothetical protein
MFEDLLARLGASLRKHRLPYMIIGGQAVLLYGEPRLTRDIDITLGVNTDRLDELLTLVKGLLLRPIPQDPEAFVMETMVLPTLDDFSGIRVDFIFSFTPYESRAIRRARKITLLGQEVCFASPEDLIIHKIFAGRPRDLEDVRSVLLRNRDLDVPYIRDRLKEFDASLGKDDFLSSFEGILKDLRESGREAPKS